MVEKISMILWLFGFMLFLYLYKIFIIKIIEKSINEKAHIHIIYFEMHIHKYVYWHACRLHR